MSLPVLAQHMASKGRGQDSMLIHMTPGEVQGLQALAMAHGGSLSVNPDTGLPEAGFLKSILPAVLGMALAPMTAGTSLAFLGTPMGAAMTVGGIGALATGSLEKGLVMGLGAYGGAGLGGSLASAGTGAISSAAGANVAALPTATTEAITSAAGTGAAGAAAPAAGAVDFASQLTPEGALVSGMPAPAVAPVPPTMQAPLTEAQAAPLKAYDLEMAQQRAVGDALAKAGPMDTLKAGAKSVMDKPSQFMTSGNLKYGLAAAAPMMMATNTIPGQDEDSEAMIRPYRFDPVGGQYTRLTPYPAREANTRFAEGGETDAGDPAAAYRQLVEKAYGKIGRTGFGFDADTQIDQPGYDYWVNQLSSGTLNPQDFTGAFKSAALETKMRPYTKMTGDSAAAYDYLMGKGAYPIRTTQPRVSAPYAEAVMGLPSDPTTQKYLWDAEKNKYYANPAFKPMEPLVKKEDKAAKANADSGQNPGEYLSGMGGAAAGGVMYGYAGGGISHLGDYSDGGRLLKGPGDGVSDSIPATIADKRPARLADGEFVVPARVVSELGNGSTDAGARKLYAMMDRIQNNRRKSVGKGKVAVNSRSEKYLPA